MPKNRHYLKPFSNSLALVCGGRDYDFASLVMIPKWGRLRLASGL